jgi:hypothetical protein
MLSKFDINLKALGSDVIKKTAIIINWRKKSRFILTVVLCCCLILLVTCLVVPSPFSPSGSAQYVILAANDLGMHCIQPDYASFLVLPPGNNLKVQVFKKGHKEAELVTKGITVEYTVNDNTTSIDKTNFWQYAADYGFDIMPNEGITGNKLTGICTLSKDKNYFEATAIPVLPYNDGQKKQNPYQTATVTVKNSITGKVLSVENRVVLPVSTEMMCSNCHGTTNTDQNILRAHDNKENTQLYTDLIEHNKRHKCSECHQDNILGAVGKPGLPSLSLAMHGFHAPKMGMSKLENPCNNCHPGVVTKCSRGVMAAQGLTCNSDQCHGDMAQVAQSQKDGRQAWLEEPDCGNCHGNLYASNPNSLYHNSYLMNGPDEMNETILCLSCHNSPHAEWPSTLAVDNSVPINVIGKPDFINKCTACHQGSGKIHLGKK